MKKYSSILGALAALSLRRLPGEVKEEGALGTGAAGIGAGNPARPVYAAG
jgi:hypothetical protein